MAEDRGVDLSPFRTAKPVAQLAVNRQAKRVLRALGIGDLGAIPPKRLWLVANLLLRKAVTMLVSPGGQGKSLFLVALALSAASGRPFLDLRIFGGPLSVLYISAEDNMDEVALRVRAAMLHHKLSVADLATLKLIGADGFGLAFMLQKDRNTATFNEEAWQALEDLLDELQVDILIVDPLVSIMGGVSLNDNAAMALFQGRLVQLAVRRSMAIVVAHHTAKFREIGTAEAAMGAASIVNLARISLALETITEKDAPALGVLPSDARSVLRLVGTKQNRSKALADDQYFRKVSVTIPNAAPPIYPHGDEVGVIEVFTPTPGISPYPKPVLDAALAAIRQAQPPLSPKSDAQVVGNAVSAVTGHAVSDREARAIVANLVMGGAVAVQSVAVPRQGNGTYPNSGAPPKRTAFRAFVTWFGPLPA